MAPLLYWTLPLCVIVATCVFRVSGLDNGTLPTGAGSPPIVLADPDFTCIGKTEDGIYRNSGDCGTFLQCTDEGRGMFGKILPCPAGLHFNEDTKRCTKPCDAFCTHSLSCKCGWSTCGLATKCFLKKEPGTCSLSNSPRYFFNKRTGQCEKFVYGGCLKNDNNFETKEACERDCGKVAPNVCHLPKQEGTCPGQIPYYFFNKETAQCEKFVYSGCDGNANRFKNVQDCEKKCGVVPPDVCLLPPNAGECFNFKLNWYYYDKRTGQCEKFIYRQCAGESNAFRHKKDCEKRCGIARSNPIIKVPSDVPSPNATSPKEDIRFQCPPHGDGLYPDPRNCSTFVQCSNGRPHAMHCPKGLHYSDKTKRCEQPCDAHCNSTLSCKCGWPTCDLPETCFLPVEVGPCRGSIPRYFFDKRTGECVKFFYGGCEGNANNFETRDDCEEICNTEDTQDLFYD